jgi:uncharacterized damage-inducible protein DinB
MSDIRIGQLFLEEFRAELPATRKCLERIPEVLYSWKPHEKSMEMGYLVLLVAEMPKWLTDIITVGDIDLATYPHVTPVNTAELVQHFEENVQTTETALEQVTNDALLNQEFHLKSSGNILFSASKKDAVSSTINHWIHHRGQLTVYMRLNDIAVPSIYGPSADDKSFSPSL